ncbi:MAG: hypothetical protein CME65_10985 [Halobacteriovoraceae bacterium]|nr:hypothetical protein [Halobacteriovoraceae bacterium]|tara:strand:+ start:1068 stop:1694 length:627 start_codon:yes stop_codon:yes gene_type:complete
MKSMYLTLLTLSFSIHSGATLAKTLSDSIGSSDKSDYPITIETFGRAIISQLKNVEGSDQPQEVVSQSSIMHLQNMQNAYADEVGNTFPIQNASFEHALYKLGATALYTFAHYVEGSDGLSDISEKFRELLKSDLKPIVHFIHPKTTEEAYCLNVNWTGSNCPDVFADGLQESEMACFRGKPYIKCQIQCKEITSGRTLDYTEGPCQD